MKRHARAETYASQRARRVPKSVTASAIRAPANRARNRTPGTTSQQRPRARTRRRTTTSVRHDRCAQRNARRQTPKASSRNGTDVRRAAHEGSGTARRIRALVRSAERADHDPGWRTAAERRRGKPQRRRSRYRRGQRLRVEKSTRSHAVTNHAEPSPYGTEDASGAAAANTICSRAGTTANAAGRHPQRRRTEVAWRRSGRAGA